MFESRTSRREYAVASARVSRRGAKSRRLGIEMMEGRLMLSATSISNTPAEIQFGTLAATTRLLSASNGHVSIVPTDGEGGFIDANAVVDSQTQDAATQSVGLSVAQTTSYWTATSGVYADNSDGWALYSLGNLSGTNQISIVVSHPNINPTSLDTPRVNSALDEGGAIPISNLQTDLQKEIILTTGEPSLSAMVRERSATVRRAGFFGSAPTAIIGGEWGRGVVFETATGELGGNLQSSLNDHATTRPSAQVLPNGELSLSLSDHDQTPFALSDGSDGKGPATDPRTNAETKQQHGLSSDTTQTTSNSEAAGIHLASYTNDNLPSSLQRLTRALPEQGLASAALRQERDVPTALAAAEAFDQFGEQHSQILESPADGTLWRRSRLATPLLMILALERLAALRSPRAQDEIVEEAEKQRQRARNS